MSEGLIWSPVNNIELDTRLRGLAMEYLTENGDTNVEIMDITEEYSNYNGYSYLVEFNTHAESGMLKITFENDVPTIVEC